MRGALASALLLALAYPPLQVAPLPFFALVPFAVGLARVPTARPRQAALAGGVFGALHFALVLYWMPLALARHDPATVPIYGVVVGALALLFAAVGWTLHHLRHRGGLPMALALPLVWTGAEWLRAQAGPVAYPWLGLGTALASAPAWAGIAEWVGARGVTLWIAAVNGLLADAWLLGALPGEGAGDDAHRRARAPAPGEPAAPFSTRGGPGPAAAGLLRWAGGAARAPRRPLPARMARAVPLALALGLAAAPVAWGVWRARTLPVRPVAEVVLVQTGVPAGLDVPSRIERTLAAIAALTPDVEPGAALVVLPEMAVPVPPTEALARPLLGAIVTLAHRAEAPVLFGAPGVVAQEGGEVAVRNSVFVATSRGVAPLRFDKRALVPGVEATGLLDLGWPGSPPAGYEPGTSTAALRVGEVLWGPLVCFESAFPDIARELRQTGADVLVNVTNDGWLAGTWGLDQHPAHLVMRAIETRAGVVRAATTGRTLVIDPTGQVREAVPPGGPALLRATVRTTDVVTGFVRWGDVAGPACAVLAALLLLLGEVRQRRARWAREGVPERYRGWWWGVTSSGR